MVTNGEQIVISQVPPSKISNNGAVSPLSLVKRPAPILKLFTQNYQDILFFGGLFGNWVIYLQSTFFADGLATAASSHSVKETHAI